MIIPFVSITLLVLIGYILAIKRNPLLTVEISKPLNIAALLLKLLAAYSLYAIYSYYYTDRASADLFKYFDDASTLFNATTDNLNLRWQLILGYGERTPELDKILVGTQFWDTSSSFLFNDNRTMIRLNLILYHFSNGVYHFHLLFFTLLSYFGSLGIYRFFKGFSKLNSTLTFIISFVVPSLLLWCSGPLKESWLLFGMGLSLYNLKAFLDCSSKKNFIGLAIGILILISIKIYILFALIPGIVFLIISKANSSSKKTNYTFLFIHLMLGVIFLVNQELLISLMSDKLVNFTLMANKANANSLVFMPFYDSFLTFITAVPNAFFNTLIRPVIPTNLNLFSSLAAIENFVFLLLLVLPLFFYKKPSLEAKRLVMFCFSFVLITSMIIGLTCPVLGAIVRYKAPILPFYAIGLLTFVDIKRIRHYLKL